MPRCPDCNRFVSLDASTEPEADLEVQIVELKRPEEEDLLEVTLTGTVRIVNCCAECGAELSEYTFDIDEVDTVLPPHTLDHTDEGEYEGTVNAEGLEREEEAKPRLYGFQGQVEVFAGSISVTTFTLSEFVAPSEMESLV